MLPVSIISWVSTLSWLEISIRKKTLISTFSTKVETKVETHFHLWYHIKLFNQIWSAVEGHMWIKWKALAWRRLIWSPQSLLFEWFSGCTLLLFHTFYSFILCYHMFFCYESSRTHTLSLASIICNVEHYCIDINSQVAKLAWIAPVLLAHDLMLWTLQCRRGKRQPLTSISALTSSTGSWVCCELVLSSFLVLLRIKSCQGLLGYPLSYAWAICVPINVTWRIK